jgi:hypothetical protein
MSGHQLLEHEAAPEAGSVNVSTDKCVARVFAERAPGAHSLSFVDPTPSGGTNVHHSSNTEGEGSVCL